MTASHRNVVLAVCIGIISTVASGQEWTRFRGPNGTGISDATTVPTAFSPADYNWKITLPGGGHSSPVIWGERIFLTSADEASAQRIVQCFHAADGRVLWTRKYDSSHHTKHKFNSFASATPAVDESQVYVAWSTPEEYTLVALDHDGNEVWKRALGPFISQHSCGVSPVVYKDLVILGNEQDGAMEKGNSRGGQSSIIAVDRKTGETKWKLDRNSVVVAYSTPCVYTPEGGADELIFNSQAHGIYSVNPNTGKVNWEIGGLFDKRSCSSSLLASGLLIGSCGSGAGGNYLVAVHPGGKGKPDAGKLAYKIDRSAPYVPTPLAVGDWLFLWSDAGVVTCMKASTGETLWTKRVGGSFFGSPVCVAGRIYCMDTAGICVVLAADDEFQELARNDLGELSHSTPAISGGRMYLRTFTHLISVGGKRG